MSGQDHPGPARTGEPTRNVAIGVTAFIVAAACGVAALYFAMVHGGWWWLTWIPLGLLGGSCAYGVRESFQRVPRDAKGNRIK